MYDNLQMAGSPDSCRVCAEVAGTIDVPGGQLYSDDMVVAFHHPPQADDQAYAGYLFVVPRRHVSELGDLENGEAASIGLALRVLARSLRSIGATRVYTATIGHQDDHVHVHVIPRWPGTPSGISWHAVDEWPGARRLKRSGIAAICHELRCASG
jgi:histidine triad (HIT) family protein